jgi:hypothetical protein
LARRGNQIGNGCGAEIKSGILISTFKVFMPTLYKFVVIFFNNLMYAIDFSSCEAAAALQSDWS